MKELLLKFKGAFIASALGDAIGELAFKYRRREQLLKAIQNSEKLIYTDDTAMAIALAEYLIENETVDVEKLGEKFACSYEREPWRGYGPGPPKIFKLVKEKKISFEKAAQNIYPGGSFGNGAAMRITPAGLYFSQQEEKFYENIRLTCLPTHTHPLAVEGAVIIAFAIGFLLKRDKFENKELIEELLRISRCDEFKDKIKKISFLIDENCSLQKAKIVLGNNSTALGSVPFAIFAFLKNKENFKEGLISEVLISGDRDTVGCMSGALWGAYLGIRHIPSDWLHKLENLTYIEKLADKLYRNSLIHKM